MKKSKWFPRILIIIISCYLLIPFVVTLIYSLFTDWVSSIVPKGFTLKNYAAIMGDSVFWGCILRTIIISIVPIAIATIILLLAMFVVIVHIDRKSVV